MGAGHCCSVWPVRLPRLRRSNIQSLSKGHSNNKRSGQSGHSWAVQTTIRRRSRPNRPTGHMASPAVNACEVRHGRGGEAVIAIAGDTGKVPASAVTGTMAGGRRARRTIRQARGAGAGTEERRRSIHVPCIEGMLPVSEPHIQIK